MDREVFIEGHEYGTAPALMLGHKISHSSNDWRHAYRWWVRDPLKGARLYAAYVVMRLLPTGAVSALGSVLGKTFAARLHPAAARRVRAGLAALRPDIAAEPAALDAATARLWSAVGRAYAEITVQDRLWPEGRVTVEGEENLQLAKAGGRAVIVAGLHLGNWEVVPITFGYAGHRFVDVYLPPANRFEARIAHASRVRVEETGRRRDPSEKGGVRLIPPSLGSAMDLLRALRAGEHVLMFVDEYAGGRVHAPAFGRPLSRHSNIARVSKLAQLSGAAIVPAFCLREAGARFKVHFLPPLTPALTGDREADMQANMQALNDVVEPIIRTHIEQWYMLVDFNMDR